MAPALDTITVTLTGTALLPIRIRNFDDARPAIYRRTVQAYNCQHVIFERMKILLPRNNADSAYTGCALIDGSSSQSVEFKDLDTLGGVVGFQVNQSCGKGHLLNGATIRYTTTLTSLTGGNGIGVSNTTGTSFAMADRCVTIRGVYMEGAASHGMELQGNFGVVEQCTILYSGLKLLGCSGIHILNSGRLNAGPGTVPLEGTDWHILNNVVAFTRTPPDGLGQGFIYQQDGNGIQSDHECARVLIQGNICFGNDGSGIAIYDSADVEIYFNTCYDNHLDAAGMHLHRGEITIGSDENVLPTFLDNVKVIGNLCVMPRARNTNNIALPPPDGFSVSLYPHIVQVNYNIDSVKNRVEWGYNWFAADGGGNANILRWGSTTYTTVAAWNAARTNAGAKADGLGSITFTGPRLPEPKYWLGSGGSHATIVAVRPAGAIETDIRGAAIPSTNARAGALQA